MKIITEEMRYRKRLCEYALKNGLEKNFRKKQKNIDFTINKMLYLLSKLTWGISSVG